MRIGILGGTFNPVHYGHLINAEIIRGDFALDRIVFVPARYPVHKELDGEVPSEDRFRMLALAVGKNSGFEVSRIEIDRDGPSYTITTVTSFKDLYPESEIFVIIGMDSLNEIDTWKDSDSLLKAASFIVMNRPGFVRDEEKVAARENAIRYAGNPVIDISSSCIRERIRAGQSVRYLLPDTVAEYIQIKGLYRN